MKKYKLFLLIVSIIVVNLNTKVLAQDVGALQRENSTLLTKAELPHDIKSIVDNFFGELIKKNYRPAVEKLIQNSPISKKDEGSKDILKQLQKAIDMYGEIKKYEVVSVKPISNNYIRLYIIGLHQKYPTRWEITFYRSPDLGLIVSNLRFDDQAEELFNIK